jgi:hypothetical protein
MSAEDSHHEQEDNGIALKNLLNMETQPPKDLEATAS